MGRLSKSEAIKKHRKIWNWIADETLKQKRKINKNEYFMAHKGVTDTLLCDCCCCEYVIDYINTYSHDYKKAAKLARQIAELPERR